MRQYVMNLMAGSSALSMSPSSAVPGSSTPLAAGTFIPTVVLPYIATSAVGAPNPLSCQKIEYGVGYCVSVSYIGSKPEGILQLMATNDFIEFTPIAGSSTLLPGTSGATTWNVDRAYYEAVQVQFLPTSAAAGNIVRATLSSKGWP